MALISGVLLCGLTAFGGHSYLYDSDSRMYDIDHAKFSSYGNILCVYDVRVSHYYYTNTTYGTAVILYDSFSGCMKIFTVAPVSATTHPSIRGIEAYWTGSSDQCNGVCSDGAADYYYIALSWNPIYPTLSKEQVVCDGLAPAEESAPAPAPVMTLSADEDISATADTYRFFGSVDQYTLLLYVYGDVSVNFFPMPEGYSACALGMLIEVYKNNALIGTTDGIFYGFKLNSYQYRTFFAIFPNSQQVPISLSILCNYFSLTSQNSLVGITPVGHYNIILRYAGN